MIPQTKIILIFLVCLFLFLPGIEVKSAVKVAYDFNEGAGEVLHDKSGNENHAKISGAKWVLGKLGFALQFDGEDDHADAPYNESFDIRSPLFRSFTVECWINVTKLPGKEAIIFGKGTWEKVNPQKGTGRDTGDWEVGITNQGIIFFNILTDGSSGRVESKKKIEPGNWYHIAAMRTNPFELALYIDTEKDATTELNSNITEDWKNDLHLAWLGEGEADKFFCGIIDEFRWSDQALKPEELWFYKTYAVAPSGKLTVMWGELKIR